jgi:hypothetical protein
MFAHAQSGWSRKKSPTRKSGIVKSVCDQARNIVLVAFVENDNQKAYQGSTVQRLLPAQKDNQPSINQLIIPGFAFPGHGPTTVQFYLG